MRTDILLEPAEEIEIVVAVKKHGLTVVAAIVEMIILVGQEGVVRRGILVTS